MRHVVTATVLAIFAASGLCSIGHAQAETAPPGIVVAGVGIVKVRPDQVRIEVQVQGKAEITDDALVKYGDAKRRLTEALEKLKLANLKVDDQAISLASSGTQAYQAMFGGGGGNQGDTATPIEVSGNLRIELSSLQQQSREDILKTLGKLLDTIKDAGGGLGPSQSDMMAMRYYGRMPSTTAVKFMVNDFKSLREKAYEQAVEDARVRGTRLATLNGVKLGRVAAVQEVQVSGDPMERSSPYPWYYGGGDTTTVEKDEISTNTLGEVPVSVRLLVRFEIAEADAPQAAAAK